MRLKLYIFYPRLHIEHIALRESKPNGEWTQEHDVAPPPRARNLTVRQASKRRVRFAGWDWFLLLFWWLATWSCRWTSHASSTLLEIHAATEATQWLPRPRKWVPAFFGKEETPETNSNPQNGHDTRGKNEHKCQRTQVLNRKNEHADL